MQRGMAAHTSMLTIVRVKIRQTSSLNTARGRERRHKVCAKLAQKSREVPAGKSGLCKRLIFGVLQGVSGFFNHDTIPLRRVCGSSPEARSCHFLDGTPNV
jgi:hypothetical protein